MDSITLAAVTDSLQPLCQGRIQGINQPEEHSLVLTAYSPETREVRWLIDCSTLWPRTHFITARSPNPPNPPAFCMTLRKYIEGGQIVAIEQRGFDRILDIHIRGLEGLTYLLTAEFMGKHSNIILVSPEGVVLQTAKLITAKINRYREVLPGKVYVPPPPSRRVNPLEVSEPAFLAQLAADQPDEFAAWLRQSYEGIGATLAAEIAARAGANASAEARWKAFAGLFDIARSRSWQPVLLRGANGEATGAYPLRLHGPAPELQEDRSSIHTALNAFYVEAIPRAALEAQRRSLQAALRKTLASRDLALDQVRHGTKEGDKAAQYRHWGELLLANLHQLKTGQDSATVLDYYADPPSELTIRLEPLQTPQANAERFFRRARHVEANAAKLGALEGKLTAECAQLREVLERIGAATMIGELLEVRAQATEHGWLQAGTASAHSSVAAPKSEFEGKRIRSFASPDGTIVLVGENAEANDYLVRRVALPNDWWLHVRSGTSAHVVIKTDNAPLRVAPLTIQYAAQLAAAYSRGKHSSLVAVDYTLRKYVRKPRKAAPGMVTYTHEKTLDVTPLEIPH